MTTARTSNLRQPLPAVSVNKSNLIVFGLGFLILMGAVASIGRLLLGMGATTNLSDTYPWGIWIGFDFLMIALAGAGFTMAAAAHVFHIQSLKPAVRPAILAGMMGYVAVLLLLVLDLGRPDRFYSFIINWNLHSPLFEISWCVLLYTTVLAIEVSPYLFERIGWNFPVRWFFRVLTLVTIIGVTLSSLHQSTLGTLYLNMPHRLNALWYTPLLPVMFFTSSILAGLSVAMLAYLAATRIAHQQVRPETVAALGKGIVIMGVVYATLKVGEIAVAGEMRSLLSFDAMSLLWWAEIVVGVFIPIILLVTPSLRARPLTAWVAPLFVILGIGLNRFDATLFAQKAIGTASYVPHLLEWVSTIGILAAAALAWYLGVRLLVIFDSKAEKKYHH